MAIGLQMIIREDDYLLRQPKTLESMALKKIAAWIVSHGEKLAPFIKMLRQTFPTKAQELLSRQIEIIRNHIESRLPGRFHDKAMAELQHTLYNYCDYGNNNLKIIASVIEALFTKNITSLSLLSVMWKFYEEAFYSKSHLIPGLTHINSNLGCVDVFLQFIEKNFKLIESLNLRNSGINDDCIDILIKFGNLKSVNLSDTQVSETGIEKLLTSCPNIEHIVTDVDIAQVINNIVKFDKHDERRFSLKSYLNKPNATLEQHQLVVKTCPLIEHLDLSMQNENDHSLIFSFQDSQYLRELVLCYCLFYTNQVKDFLLVRGSNLVHLWFQGSYEIDLSSLKHIYVMCPNLQQLDLLRCSYYDYDVNWKNDTIPCKENILPLKYLKRISVKWYLTERPAEHFIFLLSYCPNIEFIDISGCDPLDNVILNILDNFPKNLMYLRELRFRGQLSKSVMDRIVQNCVNPLEVMSL